MKNLDKEYFISICNSSLTMAKACATLGMHFNTFRKYAIQYGCYKPNPGGKGDKGEPSPSKIPLNEILEGKHPQYQTYKLKNKLLQAGLKINKCECCGLTDWNGKPLMMELHHIDGDKTNHKLENLQMLCPNCHSQTETFRAKNIK